MVWNQQLPAFCNHISCSLGNFHGKPICYDCSTDLGCSTLSFFTEGPPVVQKCNLILLIRWWLEPGAVTVAIGATITNRLERGLSHSSFQVHQDSNPIDVPIGWYIHFQCAIWSGVVALGLGGLYEGLMRLEKAMHEIPRAGSAALPDQNSQFHLATGNLDWNALHTLEYLGSGLFWWVVRTSV